MGFDAVVLQVDATVRGGYWVPLGGRYGPAMDGEGPADGRKGPTNGRRGPDGRQRSGAWTAMVRRVDAGSYRWTSRSDWATLRPGLSCPLLFQPVTRRSFLRGVRYPGHGTNVSSRVDQALRCVLLGPGGADE